LYLNTEISIPLSACTRRESMKTRTVLTPKSDFESESSDEDSSFGDHGFARPQRMIDPGDPDIYIDALFAPLLLMFERQQGKKKTRPRFLDYFMVSSFLVLNYGLSLAVAYKINQLTEQEYGEFSQVLFDTTCFTVGRQSLDDYYDTVMDSEFKQQVKGEYDCVQPSLLLLTQSPEHMDLNHDGFWSKQEANAMTIRLSNLGVESTNFSELLDDLIAYDDTSGFKGNMPEMLDLSFFVRHSGLLKLCIAGDTNLCGNLEKDGTLASTMLPGVKTVKQRLRNCRHTIQDVCPDLFGEMFRHLAFNAKKKICGQPDFLYEAGVNIVNYEKVQTYTGEEDSIESQSFVSFLVMLLFVWVMVMLQEFRGIHEFFLVVWNMSSANGENDAFASLSEDGKMKVERLPWFHKAYATVAIVLGRSGVSLVVFLVGVKFLSSTDNLMDLVLNSTALGFLVEIDNMIHMSFMGHTFTRAITDRCEAMTVTYRASRATQAPWFYFLSVVIALGAWSVFIYQKRRGLIETAHATACLCHLEGDCLARTILGK